ncbi:MAG: lysophospholipase L1-like esterase, partial [Planctomycetota bacterium]
HDAKFHGENQFPEHFQGVHGNGEYKRMNEAQKATWDAHYEPLNQRFIEAVRNGDMTEKEVTAWKYQRYIKDYLGCIAAVDENVGRVLDYLDENGLSENTIVIYSSDQGFYLGEHGWYDKRWIFEESLQMPFLIRWPGVVQAGVRSETLIQNIDYAPTFLDIAGAETPAAVQGRSLLPVLHNAGRATNDWRDAIYYAYYENASVHNVPEHDGLRTLDHKLAFIPRTREWQLFDLVNDPDEMLSVHAAPEKAGVLAALKKRYHDLRRFYDVNSAVIPATKGEEAWWQQRFQAQKTNTAEGTAQLVFIGDSITQAWEGPGKDVWQEFYADRNPLNLGISGDRTEHVLWRLEYGGIQKINPKVAVVMIGTNNTGHKLQDPVEIAAGVTEILAQLQSNWPETHVLLLGIFPRGREATDIKRQNNIAVNQMLRRMTGPGVSYLDIGDAFLSEDGSLPEDLMPDALHLTPKGYRLWAESMEASLLDLGI